jgi:folate-binding protein YgfZ
VVFSGQMELPAFVLDFQGWAVVRITGPDALEFLQGTGTQDVAALSHGAAAPTLFLTEKGRPVTLAWATVDQGREGVTLLVEPGGREALLPHLDRLRVMEEVAFEGPQGMPLLFGVVGPGRADAARERAAAVPGGVVIDADPVTFLLVPREAEKTASVAELTASVVSPASAEAWRVALGIPRAGLDFDLERIATELSLPQAISLDKGCFVGQEVVARTTHRGAVRRHRIGFRYPGDAGILPRGTELKAGGTSSGFITSTALQPGTGRGLGMGYLTTEALQNPAEILAIHDTLTTRIEVSSWPL